jgi:hypothetical protein
MSAVDVLRRGSSSYLDPIGDFDVDLADALHPVVQDVNSLGWLKCGLRRKGTSTAVSFLRHTKARDLGSQAGDMCG